MLVYVNKAKTIFSQQLTIRHGIFSRLVHQELLKVINLNCIKQELREQGTLSSLIER